MRERERERERYVLMVISLEKGVSRVQILANSKQFHFTLMTSGKA